MLYHCRMWCYAIGIEAVFLRSWCVTLRTVLTVLYTVYCMTHWIAVSWTPLTVLLICELLRTDWNV